VSSIGVPAMRFGVAASLLGRALAPLLLGLAIGVAPVAAAEPTPTPPPLIGTRVALTVPDEVAVGSSVDVSARLMTLGGNAIGTARVTLQVNGVEVRASRTDTDGAVTMSVPSTLLSTAGSLVIRVAYSGDATRGPSAATATLVVRPATIQVTTVPAVAGMAIHLGDQTVVTDARGIATFEVGALGTLRLAPTFELPAAAGRRVSFVRWEDDVYDAERTIDVSGDEQFVLGVRLAVRTSLRFVDPDGAPVDPGLVQTVVMETGSGPGRTVTTFDEVWLDSAVPVKRTFGLVAVPNLHRVKEVLIAGTNTVNRGQQIWEPTLDGTWTIQVLLFRLDARIEDALLGSPISTDVTLEYPDGTSRTLATDEAGRVSFGSLPRGDYRLLMRTGGLVPPSPIAMSKPQDVTIRIISTVDLAIGGGLLVATMMTLLVLGRRHQIVALGHSGRRSTGALGARLGTLATRLGLVASQASGRVDPWLRGRLRRWTRATVRRRGAGSGRLLGSPLSATIMKSDRAFRNAVRDPRRRMLLAATCLVVMALAVLATAAVLVSASPLS